jgi:hypothetical protein
MVLCECVPMEWFRTFTWFCVNAVPMGGFRTLGNFRAVTTIPLPDTRALIAILSLYLPFWLLRYIPAYEL